MTAFYWTVECPMCDSTTYQGINVTALSYKGLPAIPVDMGAATSYRCPECEAMIHVDDVHMYAEDNDEVP